MLVAPNARLWTSWFGYYLRRTDRLTWHGSERVDIFPRALGYTQHVRLQRMVSSGVANYYPLDSIYL